VPNPKLHDRRLSDRIATRIPAEIRSAQGARYNLVISDLSVDGCAIVSSNRPLKPGQAYGLKIRNLEVLGSIAAWTNEGASGLRFEQSLHPAVAAHFAALYPPPQAD
jgi:hypothetical protein